MMRLPEDLDRMLGQVRARWLLTGVAGFIGSNLLEALLERDQSVRGLDNFTTGHQANLDQVRQRVSAAQWKGFEFREADIADLMAMQEASRDVEFVLHQAALGSVPASLEDPAATHQTNVTGTFNVFLAARDQEVRRVVYASSCAVYGNREGLPIHESQLPDPQSPYAASKLTNELYAQTFSCCFGLPVIGLRYFNVFGPRQDPNGPYAAVIPHWTRALSHQEPLEIYGDGESSRDFCFVADVVQANLRAALTTRPEALQRAYNIGTGQSTSLNHLLEVLRPLVGEACPAALQHPAQHRDFRAGDIRHSQADIGLARRFLGYEPLYTLETGLHEWIPQTMASNR